MGVFNKIDEFCGMSRIFITGSADGLGKVAAGMLVAEGHEVILHARNQRRAAEAMTAVPGAATVVTGDLSIIAETVDLARQVNELGTFDAVIHNAGVGYRERLERTPDGLPTVVAVNSLAPYILTCLITRPRRLVYVSSGLHQQGDPSLEDLAWLHRRWNAFQAYSDSKLHDVILAFAVAARWPGTLSNAMEPGWVPTKMGGAGAPDSLEEGAKTEAWLAISDEPAATVTGQYFYHQKPRRPLPAARETTVQEQFLKECERICGIALPA